MAEVAFKLKEGTEFPKRFAGHEIRYNLPETVEQFRAERIAPEANADEVLVACLNGQGLNLSIQKSVKDFLAKPENENRDDSEVLAEAARVAAEFRLGVPRKRGEGKVGKVAKAEAKAEAAVGAARAMYEKVPANLRKQFRPQLIAAGTFTEAELDEIDAELAGR